MMLYFFGLNHVFNSQIWLNNLMGDCHFSLHCKFEKKRETFCPLACMSIEYVANELLFPV